MSKRCIAANQSRAEKIKELERCIDLLGIANEVASKHCDINTTRLDAVEKLAAKNEEATARIVGFISRLSGAVDDATSWNPVKHYRARKALRAIR